MTSSKIDLAWLGLDGITISVMTAATIELAWFSDETSARLDDEQFTAGEGPVYDAITGCEPILCPALATTSRWPGFTAQALRLGVGAVFAFPMFLGSTCVGARMCHRQDTGPMSDAQIAAATTLTDLLHPHLLAGDPDNDGPQGPRLRRAEVHQAAGILRERLDVPVGDALACLRAYAFSQQRPIIAVAREVTAGRLRLL
ncbi:ANTAR domain-containing protein [Amycolatopsis sp. NPDC089917]|uniref:ANTAR domain-containing protein n=1 Tax=Amycolatopsis sp. NPDC089917 TaxID=3155187 RepID=UPI003417D33F